VSFLAAAPVLAATENKAATQLQREELILNHKDILKPWKGDLDGMIERRTVRVLTVYSKAFYFVDKGVQHGVTHDHFRQFEDDLNKKLASFYPGMP
jgi:hypothetical protein